MYEQRPHEIVSEEDCRGFSGKKLKVELSTESIRLGTVIAKRESEQEG
jgi:hypothetical protein